jgi:hypothetical protein
MDTGLLSIALTFSVFFFFLQIQLFTHKSLGVRTGVRLIFLRSELSRDGGLLKKSHRGIKVVRLPHRGTFFDELCLIMSLYLVKPFDLVQDRLRSVSRFLFLHMIGAI